MNGTLIAYFSHRGCNYVNGRIIDLETGNTERIANALRDKTRGDLFEIRAEKEYPRDYKECTLEAQKELRAEARPKLAEIPDLSAYDTVFLGYPNWWGTMPMPVHTFLESADFGGKRIFPFCTHEGSGLGNSERDIRALCPAAEIRPGLAIRGSKAADAGAEPDGWLKKFYK